MYSFHFVDQYITITPLCLHLHYTVHFVLDCCPTHFVILLTLHLHTPFPFIHTHFGSLVRSFLNHCARTALAVLPSTFHILYLPLPPFTFGSVGLDSFPVTLGVEFTLYTFGCFVISHTVPPTLLFPIPCAHCPAFPDISR